MNALAAAVLVAFAAPQEKVDLRWRFEKGVERRYRLTQLFSLSSLQLTMRDTLTVVPTDVDAKGTATLAATYEAAAIQAKGVQEYAYDSAKDKEPPDHPTPRMIARLPGQTFTYRMTAEGEVLEVKGFDKLLEEMLKAAGGRQDEALAQQQLRRMLSDETMKTRLQQMSTGLPPGPAGKGATWTNTFSLKFPVVGPVVLTGTSTLVEFRGRDASIEQALKLTQPEAEDPNNPLAGLFQVTQKKAESRGTFASDLGTFRSAKLRLEMDLASPGAVLPLILDFELELLPAAPR